MNKNKAIMVGAITIWPLLYIFLFIFYMFSMASTMDMDGSNFGLIMKLHMATILHSYFLIGGYIYYIVKTNVVSKSKKTLWVVIVFIGNMMAMPIFWYLYVWKPIQKNEPDNVIPNIFLWVLCSSLIVFIGAFAIKSPFPEIEGEGNSIYSLAIRDDGSKLKEILQKDPSLANLIRERDNWTPLHGAACNGNLETVKILINADADVNISNSNHNTPLHCAAQDNYIEIAQLLLEAGAEPNIIGCKNKTPLDWAMWNDHIEMANLLKRYGAKLSTDK
jgi:hypothetical protein